MAIIVTKIETTQGNYETMFAYTLYASFSGIEERIENASIQLFVPDWLTYWAENLPSTVQSFTQKPQDGGNTLVFDLGTIDGAGVSISFGFALQFQIGTPSGTRYQALPQLWVNSALVETDASEPITLTVVPRFTVTQERILPLGDPAPNSVVYYRVSLENQGDLGGVVEEFAITCNGGDAGFFIDQTYPIVGEDVSNNLFSDISQDGLVGTVKDNSLTFVLGRYQGQRYQFIYRGTVAETVSVGDTLALDLAWTGGAGGSDAFAIGAPSYIATLSLYAPKFALPTSPVGYGLTIENQGNQTLTALVLRQEIPADITATALVTGVFHIGVLEEEVSLSYELQYTTQQGITGSLGSYSTQTAQRISLENLVEAGDRLSYFTLTLPELGVGVSSKSGFLLDGIVGETALLGSNISKTDELTWGEGRATAQKTTEISNTCSLLPLASVSPSGQYAKIGDTLRYTIGATCYQSRLENPVIGVLLPKEVMYLGNVTLSHSGYFTQTPPILPQAVVEELDGQTLVKFQFAGENAYEFLQKDKVNISFDTQVNVDALGDFQVIPLLTIADGYYPSSVSQMEVAGVTYSTRRAQWKTVLFFASLSCQKKVNGTALVQVGEGAAVNYTLHVTNNGNATLDWVEMVDLLPYVGDTGVIATAVKRGSDFGVYLSGEGVALGMGMEAQVSMQYATTADPVRFGGAFDTIGAENSWQSTVPQDLTTVRGVKITTDGSQLLPSQGLMVGLRATVPVGAPSGLMAWNSFAVDAVYTNPQGVQTHLLAVEGETVGVEVTAVTTNAGRITGRVLCEKVGVNDVGVVLYDSVGTVVGITFTAPVIQGDFGYYLFSNLPLGQYRLQFVVDGQFYQILTPEMPLVFDLDGYSEHNATLKRRNPIDDLLMVNQSSRRMLRTVVHSQMSLGLRMDDALGLLE